jgi:hypothetical protein
MKVVSITFTVYYLVPFSQKYCRLRDEPINRFKKQTDNKAIRTTGFSYHANPSVEQ